MKEDYLGALDILIDCAKRSSSIDGYQFLKKDGYDTLYTGCLMQFLYDSKSKCYEIIQGIKTEADTDIRNCFKGDLGLCINDEDIDIIDEIEIISFVYTYTGINKNFHELIYCILEKSNERKTITTNKLEDKMSNQDINIGDKMSNQEDSQTIVAQYVAILNRRTPFKKVSETNLDSVSDMMEAASIGIESGLLLAQAEGAYRGIAPKIMGNIKTHLNHRAAEYNDKMRDESKLGVLKFIKPMLYLRQITDEGYSDNQMISPSDDALAYSFLMFRAISGTNSRNLEPSFQVSFSKNSKKNYDNNDILDSFLYREGSLELLGHNKDGTPNSQALGILKEDKDEVAAIVKNVFEKYIFSCNELKNSDEIYQVTVCNSYTDYSSPDYFIDMLTCLEIFNIATLPNFCKEKPEYEHIDL